VTLAVPGFRRVMQTLARAQFKTVAGRDLPIEIRHEINVWPATGEK
jgi:hypothetical protein